MPGVAVKSLDNAGGTQLAGGQNIFKINGQPVVLVGDPVQPHGEPPHNAATMVEGSSIFRVKGVPVCRAGDRASCGHVSTGQSNFNISK